jgi:methionyl-tRNA synthetase
MELARAGNKYIDEKQPWRTRTENPSDCSTTLRIASKLIAVMAYLSWPFMPSTAERIWKMLGMTQQLTSVSWDNAINVVIQDNQPLGEVEVLFNKIEDSLIEEEIAKLKGASVEVSSQAITVQPLAENVIKYDHFSALDLRVAKVLKAEPVKKAKKLLKLEVDIGVEKREIVAGIAEHYKPEELVGKSIVVVVNLEPRKIMGLESRGMLLAATHEDKLSLITVDKAIPAGAKLS